MENTNQYIKVYNNIDKKHPIVARTCLEILHNLKYTSIEEHIKSKIVEFCFNTSIPQFENIWSITQDINDMYYERINIFLNNSNNTFPYIDNLNEKTEDILYSTKKILREIANNILSPLYPKFKNAEGGSFSNLKTGKSEYSAFIGKEFGEQSLEYQNSIIYSNYLSEIIAKRNALEHPNGKSGILTIHQPEMKFNKGNNTLTRLYWSRNNNRTDLLTDLYDICLNLIFFVEYILMFIIIKPNLLPGKCITIIPSSKLKNTNNIKYIVY